MDEEMDTGFGFLVHDVARQLTGVLDRRLNRYGLTRSHWRAVLYIWRTPGISQTELSEILDLSRMRVTGTEAPGTLDAIPWGILAKQQASQQSGAISAD